MDIRYKDIFKFVCTFLQPKEIARFRRLSHYHNIWVKEFFIQHYNTVHINKYLCPMCGNQFDTFNDTILDRRTKYGHAATMPEILDDDYTFKTTYTEFEEIQRYEIIRNYFRYEISFNTRNSSIQRSALLCEQCSLEDIELDIKIDEPFELDINHNHQLRKLFRYRGTREYKLYIVPRNTISWAYLVIIQDVKRGERAKINWNDMLITIPSIYSPSIYSDDDSYNGDDNSYSGEDDW
jgi:hypothetical protein